MFVNMLTKYRDDIAPELWPSQFQVVMEKYQGNFDAYANKVYTKSPLRSAEAFAAFLAAPKQKAFDKDLAIAMSMSIYERYSQGTSAEVQDKFDRGYRLFVRGLRELMPEKAFYPDANSTMRLTYGPVGDYKPADAVQYDFVTTANGILEKKDNSNPSLSCLSASSNSSRPVTLANTPMKAGSSWCASSTAPTSLAETQEAR